MGNYFVPHAVKLLNALDDSADDQSDHVCTLNMKPPPAARLVQQSW